MLNPTHPKFLGATFPELSLDDMVQVGQAQAGVNGATHAAGDHAQPAATQTQTVSGRYRSTGNGVQLELRVDVDGIRPMKRLSGDFFRSSGATLAYDSSFVVQSPTVTVLPDQVTIEGGGAFTGQDPASHVKVVIPRVGLLSPPAAATVEFSRDGGSVEASFQCPFASPFFRSVEWEQDSVTGAVPFVTYNTGSLPQPPGSTARVLSVVQAYGEAGIEVRTAGTANVVDTSAAGTDLKWDDSELHAAMVNNFSLWANVPQWRLYLIVASQYVTDGVRGIMFDAADEFQRQGCAVFYDAIKGTDPASQRAQLRTYVHEMGHCFNLLHSWQKDLADPPAPLGPNHGLGDLSWMNYAWRYQPLPPSPGGEAAYWTGFAFQFTDDELAHLRHAFYRDVIFGGSTFGTGAADIDPELFEDRIEDNSGLALELRAKETFSLGEPVVIEIKLATTDLRGRRVHAHLHPKDTLVQIAIRQPSGRTVLHRPLLARCVEEANLVSLNTDQPALYDSAYIGYGQDGFYFDQPGRYQVRAAYIAPDGSRVVSPSLTLRVRSPLNTADEEVADLFLGNEQGQLLSLLGSDAAGLLPGKAAFEKVLDKHAKHPMAVYARLVHGVNAERDFKQFGAEKKVTVRRAKPKESASCLTSVVDASAAGKGVDNITLNMVMRRLARAQKKAGDLEKAEATMDQMVDVFRQKELKPQVMRQISAQAEKEKARLKSA